MSAPTSLPGTRPETPADLWSHGPHPSRAVYQYPGMASDFADGIPQNHGYVRVFVRPCFQNHEPPSPAEEDTKACCFDLGDFGEGANFQRTPGATPHEGGPGRPVLEPDRPQSRPQDDIVARRKGLSGNKRDRRTNYAAQDLDFDALRGMLERAVSGYPAVPEVAAPAEHNQPEEARDPDEQDSEPEPESHGPYARAFPARLAPEPTEEWNTRYVSACPGQAGAPGVIGLANEGAGPVGFIADGPTGVLVGGPGPRSRGRRLRKQKRSDPRDPDTEDSDDSDYQLQPRKRRLSEPWSPEEDNALREGYNLYEGRDWNNIARYVSSKCPGRPPRTSDQCSQRFWRCLSPGKKGSWSPEEDRMLIDAVKRCAPKSWKQIAALVPGRCDIQCRYRLKRLRDVLLKRGDLSPNQLP